MASVTPSFKRFCYLTKVRDEYVRLISGPEMGSDFWVLAEYQKAVTYFTALLYKCNYDYYSLSPLGGSRYSAMALLYAELIIQSGLHEPILLISALLITPIHSVTLPSQLSLWRRLMKCTHTSDTKSVHKYALSQMHKRGQQHIP